MQHTLIKLCSSHPTILLALSPAHQLAPLPSLVNGLPPPWRDPQPPQWMLIASNRFGNRIQIMNQSVASLFPENPLIRCARFAVVQSFVQQSHNHVFVKEHLTTKPLSDSHACQTTLLVSLSQVPCVALASTVRAQVAPVQVDLALAAMASAVILSRLFASLHLPQPP